MKIIVVTPYYHPKVGGLEIYARQLSIALRDIKKCEIIVVTSNHTGRKTITETIDGMKVYRLGTWFKISNTPVSLMWPLQIRRVVRTEKPDLILAHTPVPSMADAAAVAAGRTPFVLAYHASTLLKGDALLFNIIASVYSLYERLTLNRANKIIAVSDYVKQQFNPKLVAKTSVVPNAVWRAQIVSRRQPDRVNFLFVGSLDRTHAWKGLDLIIEAMAAYRQHAGADFVLTIMGDGNDRSRYEMLVRTHGLEKNVVFLGTKTGIQKDAAFADATALIMYPSTANDAFPTVMLEAWARSVPVIAAAIGPIPSLIDDQIDGYLVAPKDVSALAQTMQTVAASTPQQRARIAKAAATRTKNDYTWEQQATKVMDLIKELV